MSVNTGVYDDTTLLDVDDLPEGIECECGLIYYGTECGDCWPDPLDNR